MQTINIITTGGTIDKQYNRRTGHLDVMKPVVDKILRKVNLTDNTDIFYVLLPGKDSLDFTDEDRDSLVRLISKFDNDRVLITHGTDTMQESAKAIADKVKDKTIVLTGAFIPHSMDDSDAEFNLGFAFSAAKLLPVGVYIAMNGEVFPFDWCKKDKVLSRFVSV
jgi:L-asparaginase